MRWITHPQTLAEHGIHTAQALQHWQVAAATSPDEIPDHGQLDRMRHALIGRFGPGSAGVLDAGPGHGNALLLIVRPNADIQAWLRQRAALDTVHAVHTSHAEPSFDDRLARVNARWLGLSAFDRVQLVSRSGLAPDTVRSAQCPPALRAHVVDLPA